MFINNSFFKRGIRSLCLRVFNTIENNGNVDFNTNGENFFLKNLFDSFLHSSEKKVFFDIGANLGLYSEMIINLSQEKRVDIDLHLFEPTKSCFAVLCDKFDKNKIVSLNKKAVSNKECTMEIYYNQEQSTLASLYKRNLKFCNLEMSHSEQVESIRMDSYIRDKDITHIDFIKIDIEGHELFAFEGFGDYLNSGFIDFIQFEYGGANLDSHTSLMDIYDFLEKRGFKIAKIMPKGLEIRSYRPSMENFNYSNYVAIAGRII